MTTQKATRATIKLGNIELDGFQKPDGSYCLSQTQVCEIVQKDKRSMRDFLASESPLALPYKALSGGKSKGTNLTKLVVQGDTAQNITEVPLELAFVYWLKESSQGNLTAIGLVAACGMESIERRLDAAFGIKRSEQERNDRLEARIDHADGWRKNFTDWQKLDGCESGLDYALRVKQLKAFGGLPIDVSIKDYDSRQVKKMTNCEVIYDAMRRKGLTHDEALRSL
jgi:hypothetical protein